MRTALIALTVLASMIAVAAWLKFFARRAQRMKEPSEFGNLTVKVGHVSYAYRDPILSGAPDPFRTFVNSAVFALAFALFGLPHFLAIWQFWRQPENTFWNGVHYAGTLAYWLLILAGPSLIIARDREAKRRRLNRRT